MDNAQLNEFEKKAREFLETKKVEDLVKDNIVSFEYKDVKYRAQKPNFEQKQNAVNARTKKMMDMMKNPDLFTEDELIKTYEGRGKGFKVMDEEFERLQVQRDDLLQKLGQALADNVEKPGLDKFKDQIQIIMNEQARIATKRSLMLEGSIESQLNVFTFTYLATLIAEKLENDVWIKAFVSYDDLVKQDEDLLNTVVWHCSLVGRTEIPIS